MRKIILLILMSVCVFSWEVTTHRAIDRTAIMGGQVINFYNFLNDSGLGSQTFDNRNSIMFLVPKLQLGNAYINPNYKTTLYAYDENVMKEGM